MTCAEKIATETPVARTAVSDDEEVTDGLLRAASRAHVRMESADLYDQVDPDALDQLFDHQRSHPEGGGCTVVVRLWEHVFVVSPKAVEVYE
jgi:hypothetical protein